MHPYKRSVRINQLIKEEVADIIMRKVKDPRLGFVSITDVRTTDDLKLARVFVSVLKPEDRELTMEIIESAKSFIRTELARRVKMKFIPQLEFKLDTSIEYASHIEGIFKKIRQEREQS